MTVVVDLAGSDADAPLTLDVHGPDDGARLTAALDRAAARRGAREPLRPFRLERRGPGHHTLYFTAEAAGRFSAELAGLLADLLTQDHSGTDGTGTTTGTDADAETGTGTETGTDTQTGAGTGTEAATGRRVEPSPLQRELLADAAAARAATDAAEAGAASGASRHCEQLSVTWDGPLDHARFTAAWESVFACEGVLRAAFEDGDGPSIVLHERVVPEIVRHPHGGIGWYALAEADRRRGIDPYTPGPLRITVLGGNPHPSARILLTFHHALLDAWSVRLLLRQFYRAYQAGGALPGGERRPDLGDHARWLTAQDPAPAREFWSRADAGAGTGLPGPGIGTGTGHLRTRLTAGQTARLQSWAAGRGSPESSVLHAAWALLLYRVTGAAGPATVRFSIAVSGRGILLDGIERIPAALRTPLPVAVEIDPRASVSALLGRLRDQATDLSAYEWVSPGQARSWSGQPGAERTGSMLVFDNLLQDPRHREGGPAPRAVRVSSAESLGARTLFPATLIAHHDDEERLVLTFSYDRARLSDADAVLAHTAGLLRALPATADAETTVGEALSLLAGLPRAAAAERRPVRPGRAAGPPGPAATPAGPAAGATLPAAVEAATGPPLTVLRPAAYPGAGTVCLVQSPGTPRSAHTRLAAAYPGPQALVLLHVPRIASLPTEPAEPAEPAEPTEPTEPTEPAEPAGWDADALLDLAADGPLVLGAYSGGGTAAWEIARSLAARGGRPPLVVLIGATAPATAPAADFAHILAAAARRAR